MKGLSRITCICFLFLFVYTSVDAQITINGPRFRSRYYENPQNSLTISYGRIIWMDGNNVPIAGYSSSQAFIHALGIDKIDSIERRNGTYSFMFGYNRNLSDRFQLKTKFTTGKLETGTAGRPDLIVTDDQSRIYHLSLYGSFSLSKNLNRRLQFQVLLGPELIYAKKDITIDEYIVEPTDIPETYRKKTTIVQGSIVSGLGISFRIIDQLTLFSETTMGISLPGKRFKQTGSYGGLKFNF